MKTKEQLEITPRVHARRFPTLHTAIASLALVATIPLAANDSSTTDTLEGRTKIRPFIVRIPEAEVTDMRSRIEATQLPERETVADASQGVQLAMMQGAANTTASNP